MDVSTVGCDLQSSGLALLAGEGCGGVGEEGVTGGVPAGAGVDEFTNDRQDLVLFEVVGGFVVCSPPVNAGLAELAEGG
ncbi:hypothetical protein GCM10023317_72830 [Actinopolymorpha pittospori]